MKIHLASLALLSFALVSDGATPPTPPFLLEAKEDVSSIFPGAPRIHSFAFAEWDGKWIFIAGRIAGYHGEGGKEADFPRAGSNSHIWVISPPTATSPAKTWSLPVAKLPATLAPVKDQWLSSNPQYVQVKDTLYISGGYGQTAAGNWTTYPILSAVHLPSLIKTVTTNSDPAHSGIRFIESEHVQISGGEMVHLDDGHFYLFGGHKFIGSYRDFEASGGTNSPLASQTYSSSVRKLTINPTTLAINLVQSFTHPEFRRRDLNVALTIEPDGKSLGAAAYGGVFTPDQRGFTKPIYWSAAKPPAAVPTFDQKMSAYSCAHLTLFDPDTKELHTTFFGGISGYLWNTEKATFEPAPMEGKKSDTHYRDGLQWIDTITTLTRHPDGSHSELPQLTARMAGYVGSNAIFLPVPALTRIRPDADVYDLRPLKQKRILIGYLFGGIRAFPKQFPYRDDSPDYRSGNVPTRASELVLAVYLTAPHPEPAPLAPQSPDAPPSSASQSQKSSQPQN